MPALAGTAAAVVVPAALPGLAGPPPTSCAIGRSAANGVSFEFYFFEFYFLL